MPPAFFCADRQNLLHQIRPRNALRSSIPLPAAELRKGTAVRQRHDRMVLNIAVLGILVRRYGGMYIGYADIFPTPLFQLAFQQRHGFVHVRYHNVHTHNIAGFLHFQVDHIQPVYGIIHCAGREKVRIDRNYTDLNAVIFCNRGDLQQLAAVLGFLRNYNMGNPGTFQNLMQIGYCAKVIRQFHYRVLRCIAGILCRYILALYNIIIIA